jgi:hypothetical protein
VSSLTGTGFVHIPLDYYRILGLPIQATADQLQQAHRDRALQLPRREFSDVAIEARKQLIDEAYQVLADGDRRQTYDGKFLANAYSVDLPEEVRSSAGLDVSADLGEAALRSLATEPSGPDAPSSTIAIEPSQFVGALVILLELGEYEQVIQLGRPFLAGSLPLEAESALGDPQTVRGDVVLSLALACLELGREQWQQRHYETAAVSLETGNDLLAQENRHPTIRAEIQTELYKLRPYRILELLARPLDQTRERRQGLKLLKTMLEDRGGIEGSQDDLSGLPIDDFLRFIQQLRDYLTAAEQQELFEQEARRPSPVATYLTVYALLARGFARHQPALVRRGKQLLMRLAPQQDVHLEQAVCALLLGQTEEANRALELSQEYEPLAYIREHSRNSPDLLPGLCLYAERWLKDELFPHFRDFKDQDATLKDYFADAQVQAYLEAMPVTPAADTMPQAAQATHVPTIEGSLPIGAPTLETPRSATGRLGVQSAPSPMGRDRFDHGPGSDPDRSNPFSRRHSRATPGPAAPAARNGKGHRQEYDPLPTVVPPTSPLTDETRTTAATVPPSVAERVAQLSPEGQLMPSGGEKAAAKVPKKRAKGDRAPRSSKITNAATTLAPGQGLPPSRSRSSRDAANPHWGRLALVGVVGLLGLGLVGFATMRAFGWVASRISGPNIQGTPLDISVAQPAIEIPPAPGPDEQIGVNDVAAQVINNWLEAKQASLGSDYQADRLDDILVGPVLDQWQRRASAAVQENWYWQYEHNVEVESVTPEDPTTDNLQVVAVVSERAQLFEYGVENTSASYDAVLRMQYDLIRQDGNWYVQSMTQLGN